MEDGKGVSGVKLWNSAFRHHTCPLSAWQVYVGESFRVQRVVVWIAVRVNNGVQLV